MQGRNVLFDTITNIHNPLSQRLTNTHNSIENEVHMFKLNSLQIKEFYEFIIDPLFFILQKKNNIIYMVLLEQEKIKAISDFFKRHFIHDMLKVLAFIASVGTILSLKNKFVNWLKCYFQNLAKKKNGENFTI